MRVYEAINKVQSDLAAIGIQKAQENRDQHYKFRGIDDLYDVLSPLLSKHSLLIIPFVISKEITQHQTKNGTIMFHAVVEVEYHFISCIDESKHISKSVGEARDTADKAINKALTSAYKYAMIHTFCIPVVGSEDADSDTPPPANGKETNEKETGNGTSKYIDDKQKSTILDYINDKNVDTVKFLKYMNAKDVESILATDYDKAVNALKVAKGKQAEDGKKEEAKAA